MLQCIFFNFHVLAKKEKMRHEENKAGNGNCLSERPNIRFHRKRLPSATVNIFK